MKTNNSNEGIALKFIPIIFVISSIICISIRAYQMIFLIDPETGFNLQDGIINYAVYIALGIAAFVMFSVSYIYGETFEIKSAKVQSDTLSVLSSVLSGILLFDGVVCLLSGFTTTSSITSSIIGIVYEESMLTYLRGFFAILSALYMLILAKDYKNDSEDAKNRKLMALAPVGWIGFKLMALFSTQISFVRVSDLVLELFMLAFMLHFFLSLAQLNSNVYREGFIWRLYSFGLCASLISLTINIPRLVFTIVEDTQLVNADYPFSAINLICALYIISLIFRDLKKSQEEEITVDQFIDVSTLENSLQYNKNNPYIK